MRGSYELLLLATAPLAALAADTPRPRGVGPEFAKFYKDTTSFACINNPTIKLALSQVNDDYCDCPDGSDEPGTSACSHLSSRAPRLVSDSQGIAGANTSAALPGFYCKNKGHQPGYVPFANVNDGVCDYERCCDGSEEWEKVHVGRAGCPDKCKEIGKEWRKMDDARQKSMTAALRKKAEYAADAARMRREGEEKIAVLRNQIEGQEIVVRDLEAKLVEAEIKAKGRVVKAPGGGGKLAVLVGLAKDRVEELRSNLISVRGQRDAVNERLAELEKIMSTFKEEYNPNFNDEGVKRAVRSWEDYVAKDKTGNVEEGTEKDLDEIIKPDTDTEGLKWADFKAEEQSDTDLLYEIEAYLPSAVRSWVDGRLRDLRLFLIENGVIAGTDINGDAVDPEISTAREQTNSAKSSLENLQNDLKRESEDLEKDYGPDSIFRALKGKCISKDSGEYTYEFCWFDGTKQKSKKGGGTTNMGSYIDYETVTVDEELPANGKGLGTGERFALKHANGQGCWNGPNRSTTVVLACSEVDEIWKISEEEKCVYRMEVGTPAVCQGRVAKKDGGKDEL